MKQAGQTREQDHMQQLRLTALGQESYDVAEEHSYDGGKAWSAVD